MVDIFDDIPENVSIEIKDNKIKKGEEINLTAKDPTMSSIMVGVGWEQNAFEGDVLDVDVSCFLLGKNEKTRKDSDFIFYNNERDEDESVVHNGDSRTGAGDGDDESISIDLNKIPYEVVKVMFTFSIYKGEEKDQFLSKMRKGYIRVINASNSQEILRYNLDEDVEGVHVTGMLAGVLKREGPKWHFEALGEPVEGGLGAIATGYDIIVHGG
ncbi:MAG: TerD family protein [Alphaproteobacteria bacterium]|nr:TerD family protein [Alphaproteobacteria bacterium]